MNDENMIDENCRTNGEGHGTASGPCGTAHGPRGTANGEGFGTAHGPRGTANGEGFGTVDGPRIEAAIRELLAAIGEDPNREGLLETPNRVARACQEVFGGMQEDPSLHLLKQFDEPGNEEMVIVKDIPFSSMCEHHLLPFTGRAHVCYLPRNGRITGLSKLARCVEGYARRPQLQERLTRQIADAIELRLRARGVIVVIEATHTCMTMRGIRAAGSLTVTSAVRGWFMQDLKAREEALRLIGIRS